MLLQKAFHRFLRSLEANDSSRRNVQSYQHRLGIFLEFLASRGIDSLDQVGPDEVDEYFASLRQVNQRYVDHPRREPVTGGLSRATIAGRVQAVKYFLKVCARRGWGPDRSPAAHIRVPRVSRSAKKRLMSSEDLVRLIEMAHEIGNPRDVALISFVADTGCRRGEVEGLTISNLLLDDLAAWINGKTDVEDNDRLVEYSLETGQALRAWLDVRPSVNHDFVFVSQSLKHSERGKPLSGDGIYQVFRRLALAAGVEGKFNPHALRHLVGQHYTDQTNLEIARQKLGHNDIRTTAEIYSHQDRERVKAATRQHSLLKNNGRK